MLTDVWTFLKINSFRYQFIYFLMMQRFACVLYYVYLENFYYAKQSIFYDVNLQLRKQVTQTLSVHFFIAYCFQLRTRWVFIEFCGINFNCDKIWYLNNECMNSPKCILFAFNLLHLLQTQVFGIMLWEWWLCIWNLSDSERNCCLQKFVKFCLKWPKHKRNCNNVYAQFDIISYYSIRVTIGLKDSMFILQRICKGLMIVNLTTKQLSIK